MQQSQSGTQFESVIVLFRRDLRVDDNPALAGAAAAGRHVIPVYIWATEEQGQFQPGLSSRWWFKQSLTQLQQQIYMLGSRLIVRQGHSTIEELLRLVGETKAGAVFFNNLYDPISLLQDHQMKHTLEASGIHARSFNADLLYEPWEVMDEDHQPFTDFESFWNKVKSMPRQPTCPVSCPTTLSPVNSDLYSCPVKDVRWFFQPEQEASTEPLAFQWQPGLYGAVEKLDAFLHNRLQMFEHDRAKVDRESTSQLSPWIHSGTISVRYIYYKVRQKQLEWARRGRDHRQSCEDFLQQMGYREYSRYICYHFPFALERPLLSHVRCVPWRMDIHHFKAWKAGKTGYPLIDAGMRMLWSSGWLHNRLRVVCASFLVKNLLLPWQWGLKHYWDALLDADLECDTLGWQYVAGCLRDAHPFSYMINLEVESKRFDPDGRFVARWLPELARMPVKYIHTPWTAPAVVLETANVEVGITYPHRIITEEESAYLVEQACEAIQTGTIPDAEEYGPCRLATLERGPDDNTLQLSTRLEGDGEASPQGSQARESGCEFEPEEEDGEEDIDEDEPMMQSSGSEDEVESGAVSIRQAVGCCSTNIHARLRKQQLLRKVPLSPTSASSIGGKSANPPQSSPSQHQPIPHMLPTFELAVPSLSPRHNAIPQLPPSSGSDKAVQLHHHTRSGPFSSPSPPPLISTSASPGFAPVTANQMNLPMSSTSLSLPHTSILQLPITGGSIQLIKAQHPSISTPFSSLSPHTQLELQHSGSDRPSQSHHNIIGLHPSLPLTGSNSNTANRDNPNTQQGFTRCGLHNAGYPLPAPPDPGATQQYESKLTPFTPQQQAQHAQQAQHEQAWHHVPSKRQHSPGPAQQRDSPTWDSNVPSLSPPAAEGEPAAVQKMVQPSKRQHVDGSGGNHSHKRHPMSP